MSQPPPQLTAASSHEVLREIDTLLDEVASLAQSDCSTSEFFDRALERTVFAVGGVGAGVWMADAVSNIQLAYQHQLSFLLRSKSRKALVAQTEQLAKHLSVRAPTIEPAAPQLGLPYTSLIAPIEVDDHLWGVLLVSVAADFPVSAHDGLLRFVVEIAHHAAEFLQLRERQTYRQQRADFVNFAKFSLAAHRTTRIKDVAYDLANEGQLYVGCDRITIATLGGRRCRIAAVSGVATPDRRSNLLARLETLMNAVARLGEPFIYDEGTSELPPQIEKPLQRYLDESAVRSLAILPLKTPSEGDKQSSSKPVGMMVCEQLRGASVTLLMPKISLASKHASLALSQAVKRRHFSLLRSLGSRWLPRLAVLAVLAAATTFVLMMPTDFEVVVHGKMTPQLKKHLFAPRDGRIEKLLVAPGQQVVAGELLATMRSPDLELEMKRLTGEIKTNEQRLTSVVAERLMLRVSNEDSTITESRLTAEELATKDKLENLQHQLEILGKQLALLELRSPISGHVLTWDLEQRLASRPVRIGDNLLTVSNLEGLWELQFEVPDRSMGHVLRAQQESGDVLQVRFVASLEPDVHYDAQLQSIASASHRLENLDTPSVRVVAKFDQHLVQQLHPGATVIGRIHCGERSLGYVWLHEFYEEMYRRFF